MTWFSGRSRCESPLYSLGAPTTPIRGEVARPTEDPAHRILSCPGSEGFDHVGGSLACFVVASGGGLSEGYGPGGLGVCLVHGRTEAEGVPSQGGRGDALLRMSAF